MSNEDLASVLWRERDLLELLLFKLEVEQLVLTSGMPQWLAIAANEVAAVLQEVRDTELRRALVVDACASELGLSPSASLNEIAVASEEPWQAIWLNHRKAFTTFAVHISVMSEGNRMLLTAGPAEERGTPEPRPRRHGAVLSGSTEVPALSVGRSISKAQRALATTAPRNMQSFIEVEDADIASAIVDLQMQEVAYQAALGATSLVLQPSLLDFLR
ncbi:hypothetical protein BH10ACT10_BH10ACT10_15510 [soil metagenome]